MEALAPPTASSARALLMPLGTFRVRLVVGSWALLGATFRLSLPDSLEVLALLCSAAPAPLQGS
jgi:hypothetical protein